MPGPQQTRTPGHTVPQLAGTDLGDALDDLAHIHPGLDLIRDGIHLLASDRHDLNTTQVLLAALAASPDATDVIGAIGQLVAHLTSPDTNPALRALPLDQQKTAAHQGWLTAHNLTDPDLRDAASTSCAALDHAERRCTDMNRLTDEQRKELSKKVADANKKSVNRPR